MTIRVKILMDDICEQKTRFKKVLIILKRNQPKPLRNNAYS